MADHDYDLFVIGGGSGGVRAARIAAGYGARVAIAEEFRWGGTCVIRGCVPKKLLVYASRFGDEFEDAAGFGWTVAGEPAFDWSTLIRAKDREIARLEGIYRRNLEAKSVTTLRMRAVIEGPHRVALADGRVISARHILVATGGTPVTETALPGVRYTISSNEAFDLAELPRRVVVVGGGYIAVEFAGIFHGLGAQTTLIYRGDRILRGFDDDLRDGLMEALSKRGMRIVTGTTLASVAPDTSGARVVTLKTGEEIVADQVMLAIGRKPNTAGLGLEKAGVKLGPAGEIEVDELSQTNVPGIHAVGDVTDRVNLTPIAIREGHAFADTVFGGKPTRVDHDLVPTAVFSTPEIGTIGLAEAEAVRRGIPVDIYKTRFRPMRATISGRDERTLMKLVVARDGGRVLGVHLLGPDSGEIVQMAAIALGMGATKADFDRTVALHPSAAEELVTMREKWTG